MVSTCSHSPQTDQRFRSTTDFFNYSSPQLKIQKLESVSTRQE